MLKYCKTEQDELVYILHKDYVDAMVDNLNMDIVIPDSIRVTTKYQKHVLLYDIDYGNHVESTGVWLESDLNGGLDYIN